MKPDKVTDEAYQIARLQYQDCGVNTEMALNKLADYSISIHCWQGDDVRGFEPANTSLSGSGLAVTGNYPGRARNIAELQLDLEKVYSLLPGHHRLNLHAIYGDFGHRFVERNQIEPKYFKDWLDWAKARRLKLDFNPTCFSHPKAASGFTLSHPDKRIRDFWIEHVKRSRKIAAYFGQELHSPCVNNIWIPDGAKEVPINRSAYRQRLRNSLDQIFKTKYSPNYLRDSLESKLFGIGSESFVVGSHEFYLSYAIQNDKILCLDLGHFHPTESIADKISAILQFSDELLLHISRGVRWDSDHIVNLNDESRSAADEIVRHPNKKIYIALDYFDASLNRIGAWVVGGRAMLKALLTALLQPNDLLAKFEDSGEHFSKMALSEKMKGMPMGSVWDYYCRQKGVLLDEEIISDIKEYENKVTLKRD